MIFDKNKVVMEVTTDKDTYLPGETIRGTLHVRVLREVTVTALRLHVYSKEKTEVVVSKSRTRNERRTDECLHFEKLFTFFGYSKESGRKGGATLAPTPEGEEGLVYPFEVFLPHTAAPSFSCRLERDGEVSLTYKLRALCVIDMGFDGKVDKFIRVLSATPQYQCNSMRQLMHGMLPQTVQLPPSSCCLCFSRDSDPSITVELSCPQLLVFNGDNTLQNGVPEENGYGPQVLPDTPAKHSYIRRRNSGEADGLPHVFLPVMLKMVNNSSKKTVKTVQLKVVQHLHISCKGMSKLETRPVATLIHALPSGGVAPRQAYSATLRIDLGSTLGTFGCPNERKSVVGGGLIVPTMATSFLEVGNAIEVSFPNMGAKQPVCMPDACWFVSAVDRSDKSPPVPVRYNTPVILPEEVLGGAMQ